MGNSTLYKVVASAIWDLVEAAAWIIVIIQLVLQFYGLITVSWLIVFAPVLACLVINIMTGIIQHLTNVKKLKQENNNNDL